MKNWCFWTVVLETIESPLDCKEIKPVNPKGNQSWTFTGRTDAEAETPIFWSFEELPHWKRPWYWERLKAGGEGDGRGWDGWMSSLTRWTWIWASFGSWWWAEHAAVHGVAKSQTWLSDWTVVNIFFLGIGIYNFLKKIFQNTRSFLCLILILLNLISLHPLFFIL